MVKYVLCSVVGGNGCGDSGVEREWDGCQRYEEVCRIWYPLESRPGGNVCALAPRLCYHANRTTRNDWRDTADCGRRGHAIYFSSMEQTFLVLKDHYSGSNNRNDAANPAHLVLFAEKAAKVGHIFN